MRNFRAVIVMLAVVMAIMFVAPPAAEAAVRSHQHQDWDVQGWSTSKGSVHATALTDSTGAPLTVLSVKTISDSVHAYGYVTVKNESLKIYGYMTPKDGDGNPIVPARANVVRGYLAVTSTAEQSFLAAVAGKYLDLTMLCIQNDSAAALSVVIKDSTAATTVMSFTVPATSSREFTFGNYPLIQTVLNKPWTITAAHSIIVTAQAVKR